MPVMQPGLELVRRSEVRSARATIGASIALLLALPVLVAMVPLSSLLYVGGFVASCAALAALPWPEHKAHLYPEDIADPRLRETYAAILAARAELEDVLATSPACKAVAASLLQHCDEAVRLCARIAPVANRAHAYLARQDVWALARQVSDLRTSSSSETDRTTARALTHTAGAYEQQIASCEELTRTRDRIQARLELVLASLRASTARVVKQQMLEDEQLALAGENVAEHVDDVRDELAMLESAVDVDATA